jgi:hypothetical protein
MKKSLMLVGLALVAALAVEVAARPPNAWNFATLLLQSNQTLTVQGPANFSGPVSMTGGQLVALPAAQSLAAAFQINADACGGIKQITAVAPVTSSTTVPFPAAAAANAGCMMDVVNVGPTSITIKLVAGSYNWAGAADVVLGSSDTFTVGSNGAQWYQFGTTGNN